MSGERVRVVAVLDGTILPAWLHRVLGDLIRSRVADLVGVAFVEAVPPKRRGLAFRAYQAFDQRVFAQSNDPLVPVDVSEQLARCPRVASPAEARADVALKLTGAPVPPGWCAEARLGVWSFDHVEGEARGGVPFLWEIARRHPATETVLSAHTPAGSRVLVRSSAKTDPTSVVRGRRGPLWKSATFVERALRKVAERREDPEERRTPASPAGPERAPGLLELARLGTHVALRVGHDRLRRRTHQESWFIALRRSQGSLLEGPMRDFVPVHMPADRFYADPILVPDGERLWLFYEDADRASGKGSIRCSELRADGSLGESHLVLECDYHLSYPFVFRHGDAWFMLPETCEHGTVELWRAAQFPWHWKLERVLLSGVTAVDPTLLEHDGRLWLFVGMGETVGEVRDELFIFSADALGGEWRPHPRNPVVADVRYARPAGPFFREGGELYRPGQDCAGGYGSAFWIHRVDRLDEHEYRETPVRRVDKDWYPHLITTHTIHRAGGFDVIDGGLWLARGKPFTG